MLTIKFASLEIIKEQSGKYPVLLLDDVLSELDLTRQKYILNSIKKVQTIITGTGIFDINNYLKDDIKIYKVNNGTVILDT
ncbi:DNA replication and repair protein RecF [bioreactor metagenome]|uniref:DNA replication and repair protein RecF n=1 Tax=bioreactor metagenome TaxID=1076179 RepID=A0A645ISA2_9ZZZZ